MVLTRTMPDQLLSLSTLDGASAIKHALADTYPKWNSLCMLRALGAPTLDAALLAPGDILHERAAIEQLIGAFASRLRTDRVMIRTDRHREAKDYMRGGNSYALRDAPDHALAALNDGRAVILLEPTIRYTNRGTVSVCVDSTGDWHAEALGAGFDASDLQRGITTPEYVCRGLPFRPCQVDRPARLAVVKRRLDHITMDERIACRLVALERIVMPSGVTGPQGQDLAQVEAWLRERGYTGLFKPREFPGRLCNLALEVAQLALSFRLARGRRASFVLSSSMLACGRIVFWDIADGSRKWLS